MAGHRLGSLLSLVRQGIALEVGFGTHSLEALAWVAESVEQSVYVPGSMVATGNGLAFSLANPPLRGGAFRTVRATVDGRPVAPTDLYLRAGYGVAWRTAASVSPAAPVVLTPGEPTDLRIAGLSGRTSRRTTVRLELESVAIPPLVWVEVTDDVRPEAPG